jgi:putative transposase
VIAALAVSAGRDRVQLFFRLHPQSDINARAVLAFLKQLGRHFQCPIFMLWDRFMPHRAHIVQNYISQKKAWESAFLPAYAPELNPTENVWCYLKTNPMANEALFELEDLTQSARRHGRALQRREPLLRSLLKHTPPFLRLK